MRLTSLRSSALACVFLSVAACGSGSSKGTKTGASCIDADGDGYGTGSACTCASGCSDCNDNDGTVYQQVPVYTDADHDSYGVGPARSTCIGAQPPSGFALRAGDCNDASAACASDCTDADGDGTPACAGDCDDKNPHCTETCVDADNDHYCGVHDCNDHSALHWDDCATCVDSDGDGRGPGCNQGTSDCDDTDRDNWVSCGTCSDADGDGYFARCDAYITRKGEDCDDSDAACTNDCADFDHDSVRACDGDCDDGSANNACTIDANGGNANETAHAGGNGGALNITGDTINLLGGSDALPAGVTTHRGVPTAVGALRVTATTAPIAASATLAGLFVPKGVTLTLLGSDPIILTVTDDVFVAGTIVSASGASVKIVPMGATPLDITLAGVVDLHGAPSASGIGNAGGTLTIGDSTAPFVHAVLYGAFALRSGNAVSDPGAGGGSLIVTADHIYVAAAVDTHSGAGQSGGGAVELTSSGDITVRENGIITSGGSSATAPGTGGTIVVNATTSLKSNATAQLTTRGGQATGPNGVGGAGGQCTLMADSGGLAKVSLASPTIIATGGDSSLGSVGKGGAVHMAVGNNVSSGSADSVSISGGIDVSGGTAGTIVVTAKDAASTISVDHPLLAKGGPGGVITIGNLNASAELHAAISADSTVLAQPGGTVSFEVATLTYVSGDISAVGTGGGYCCKGDTTTVSGDISSHVHDSNGDVDHINGDLDNE